MDKFIKITPKASNLKLQLQSNEKEINRQSSAEKEVITDISGSLKKTSEENQDQDIQKKKNYKQILRKDWLKCNNYKDWIQVIEGKNEIVSCRYCKKILKSKRCHLEKHRKSKNHIAASQPFSDQRQRQVQINYNTKKDIIRNSTIEAKLCLYIACHQSIMPIDHLTDIINSTCNLREEIKLHRTKCTAIIQNVLSDHFRKDLRLDIGNMPFSLLLDETNDISTAKMLGIAIVYFSVNHRRIISTYLSLNILDTCTAQSIVDSIKGTLENFQLDINNLLSIGTDNASVMVGINKGVYTLLKSQVPNLILIKCTCHSIQLAVSDASNILPKGLEFLLRETYNWFSHSSVRKQKYKTLYKLINNDDEPLTIPRISDTRWLSIARIVQIIEKQWLELNTLFSIEKTTCKTAEILSDMYSNSKYLAYLTFLQPILKEVDRVNLLFQAKFVDPSKLLNDLNNLIVSMIRRITFQYLNPNDILLDDFEQFIDWQSKLGYEFEIRISELPLNEKDEIRKTCINFLTVLIKELRNRLPDNISILNKMNVISFDKIIKRYKEDIIPVIKLFYEDPKTITDIEYQYNNVCDLKWNSETTIDLWSEIYFYTDAAGNNPFVDLCFFAIKLLSLPHSNADIERIFSSMNIAKNKIRNKMKLKTLDSILSIKFGLQRHNKCCKEYDLSENVIRKIGNMKSYEATECVDINEILSIINRKD